LVQSAKDRALGAGRLPAPEAILGIDNLPVTAPDAFTLSRDFMTMRKVGVMQAVPSRSRRDAEREVANRGIDVATAELAATYFIVARAAADAWIDSAVAAQSLQLLQARREDLALRVDAARAAVAGGKQSVAEALESEAALARIDARILGQQRQLAMGRAELGRWIGREAARELSPLPWQRELGPAMLEATQNAGAHGPLAPAAARVDMARAETKLAQAERHADWSAELSFSKRGAPYSDMVSLQFQIALPFFTRDRQDSALAASLAVLRAREASQQAEIRMHRAEIEAMLAAWRSGRGLLQQYESRLLPLAHDRASAALSAYRAGGSSLSAVLDALGDELDLQIERVQTEGEVTRAWSFLNLLQGEG
jgi:outer membrane protein TolC